MIPGAVPLAARTAVPALAWSSVTAAASAAAALVGGGGGGGDADPARVALSFTSKRHFRLDGAPVNAWAAMSGFFRTRDGWVRTHANYRHHADALRRALGLPASAGSTELSRILRRTSTAAAEAVVSAFGGLCVAVRREDPAADRLRRMTPVVDSRRVEGPAGGPTLTGPRDAPLHGLRVLDLTRVIAGPIVSQTLALLGADVLRIDPPDPPESEWVHLNTGHGKRSALLDVRSQEGHRRLAELLADAHIVVVGYRPRALEALGLSPAAILARHPGMIVGQVTAWGTEGDGAQRRGFDSLVQAESGIAWIESADGVRPGVLPAQALDHSAGHLLAAGILSVLGRPRAERGGWILEVSLRRVAAELLGMPRSPALPVVEDPDPAPHLQRFDLDGLAVVTVGPALSYPGGPPVFTPPRRWGRDPAEWWR